MVPVSPDTLEPLTDAQEAILANVQSVVRLGLWNDLSIPPEIRETARRGLTGKEALIFVDGEIRRRSA